VGTLLCLMFSNGCKKTSGLNDSEMLRTFNCGIGMVLIVAPENISEVEKILNSQDEDAILNLGVVVTGAGISVERSLKI